jgi:hypothetical protein
VVAEVAERLYQEGVGPHGERIIQHATPKTDEDQAATETRAVARHREEHPFASASEINAERMQHALTERELNGENLTTAHAQGNKPTARALHSLADLLGAQKAALEADHARYENWSAQTVGLREEGGKARAELARRGQASEARPDETTLEWWRRFERDCQAFEQHLVDLEAQAETNGTPWPPQPTAEHEAPPEAEQSNEADLNTAWSAEILEQPSYEPEPDELEATAEI